MKPDQQVTPKCTVVYRHGTIEQVRSLYISQSDTSEAFSRASWVEEKGIMQNLAV